MHNIVAPTSTATAKTTTKGIIVTLSIFDWVTQWPNVIFMNAGSFDDDKKKMEKKNW